MKNESESRTAAGPMTMAMTLASAGLLVWVVASGGGEGALAADGGRAAREPKVIYPKKTDLDFEGLAIQGEVRNPGDFYFQHRPQEKFDSLVKRRKNFHRELLRDAVLGK